MSKFYRILPEKSDIQNGWHYAACPLCGSDAADILFRAHDHYANVKCEVPVGRCRNCQFVYTNPRPFGERLSQFYPDESGYYSPDIDADRERVEFFQGAIYAGLIRHFGYPNKSPSPGGTFPHAWSKGKLARSGYPEWHGENARLLEVGCSYGGFLYQMSLAGWRTEGIELNQKAASFAREQLKLSVVSSPLEDIKLEERAYNCVILRMVLEHLPSPLDSLAQLRNAVAPNGRLIVLIPNFASFENAWFGPYCYNIHAPQHMSHFTPDTIRGAMDKTGFKVDGIHFIKSSRDIVESSKIMALETGRKHVAAILGSKIFQRSLMKLWLTFTSSVGKSSRMAVFASPK